MTAERGNTGAVTSPTASTDGAFGIGHRDGAAVAAFHQRSAQDFDKNGISHVKFASIALDSNVIHSSGAQAMRRLTIVVPVLDEAAIIVGALQALAPLRARGAEVIVVDGGSGDGTPDLARPLADRVIAAPRGRGAPLNAGAALGSGDALLFLHADTALPENADGLIARRARRAAPGAASICASPDGIRFLPSSPA